MSKEDISPGLLSKVVKFVRNPATNWADLDNKEVNRDEALSKQLLKEMIERKRRNDFVRKREFDMLRKMRKREAMVDQDHGGRPSFFQSSMPSKPDDRANTLKKIDEIEAQMSMQWWKSKQNSVSADSVMGSATASRFAVKGQTPAQPPTSPIAASQPATLSKNTGPDNNPEMLLPLTAVRKAGAAALPSPAHQPVGARSEAKSSFNVSVSPRSKSAHAPPMLTENSANSAGMGLNDHSLLGGFTSSHMQAVDVAEVTHDAELEDVAIRFANGDDAGAESGLLEMLAPGGPRVGRPEAWMVLFDFYRATAQQDKFENAALQFVQAFDRSAPQWFSMPDMVGQVTVPAAMVAPVTGQVANWICPSMLGVQTIASLKAALEKAAMPWRLDWRNLKTIDPAAVIPLLKVFSSWSDAPVQLRFMGDAQLRQLLQNAAPTGQQDVSQDWWQLRLEVLRVTHRPDEFELAALDFCVTYEVSPPSWEGARCEYRSIDHDGTDLASLTTIGEAYRDSSSSFSLVEYDTQIQGNSQIGGRILSLELSGQVLGHAIDVLDQIEARVTDADMMLISCAKLIRVDFSAAGTLLNWVSARQAEHKSVQFFDMNRLIASFFHVMGITEHARISVRAD